MNAARERTESPWMRTEVLTGAAKLPKQLSADIVVVGSGIAGLSVAYEFAERGRDVVVIDRAEIGGGMTVRTTAHLSSISDDGFENLISRRGEEMARLFHESHAAAIARIEAITAAHSIACDFRRMNGVLFPSERKGDRTLGGEFEAARQLGIAVKREKGLPFRGAEDVAVLVYPDQATFDPDRYMAGLAKACAEKGVRFFANSPVATIEEKDGRVTVKGMEEETVDCRIAIVSTNSPINQLLAIHDKQAPYRSYVVALEVPKDALPDMLYWDTEDAYHYVRIARGDESDIVIAGGEDHKSGEADDGAARFARLEAWTRAMIPEAGKLAYQWSGQVQEPIDYAGFIGRNPGSQNVFIVTGDSGQGMTHGALSGVLIADLAEKGSHRWEALYEPSRKTLKAAGTFISENTTAVKNFAEYIAPGELPSVRQLKKGQGAIIRKGFAKVAAYRDGDGTLHQRSAACTHSGCHLHWNGTERCWDCPCHGSHFAPDGSVLNGPAVKPLPKG